MRRAGLKWIWIIITRTFHGCWANSTTNQLLSIDIYIIYYIIVYIYIYSYAYTTPENADPKIYIIYTSLKPTLWITNSSWNLVTDPVHAHPNATGPARRRDIRGYCYDAGGRAMQTRTTNINAYCLCHKYITFLFNDWYYSTSSGSFTPHLLRFHLVQLNKPTKKNPVLSFVSDMEDKCHFMSMVKAAAVKVIRLIFSKNRPRRKPLRVWLVPFEIKWKQFVGKG